MKISEIKGYYVDVVKSALIPELKRFAEWFGKTYFGDETVTYWKQWIEPGNEISVKSFFNFKSYLVVEYKIPKNICDLGCARQPIDNIDFVESYDYYERSRNELSYGKSLDQFEYFTYNANIKFYKKSNGQDQEPYATCIFKIKIDKDEFSKLIPPYDENKNIKVFKDMNGIVIKEFDDVIYTARMYGKLKHSFVEKIHEKCITFDDGGRICVQEDCNNENIFVINNKINWKGMTF